MNHPPPTALAADVQASWRRFADTYEPLRPELYRYCRHLTRSPWDAEDLVQEALTRAFVGLAMLSEPPTHPRAWLFKVASNAWLNRLRQTREFAAPGVEAAELPAPSDPRSMREAAGTLLAQLSPQERAALVLKDAFGLSLAEVAEALTTTPGAIKAALHRARGKLSDTEPLPELAPTPPVLDAFCAAFNARDLERLSATLLTDAVLEYPGFRLEVGEKALREGTLRGALFGCPDHGHVIEVFPRAELRAFRGQPLVVWWVGEEVHSVLRAEVREGLIARLWTYYHAPDVLTEICNELKLPFRSHGYRPSLPEETPCRFEH